MKCLCQSQFEVRLARAEDYRTFKRVLDIGRHPAFIGRQTFENNSKNGGALIYWFAGKPVAVSLINPHYGILIALNVKPEHRSHGLGGALVNFIMPNFARVLESKVPWFEARGYRRIGKLKKGISHNTQIMARAQLFDLAGRLRKIVENNARQTGGASVKSSQRENPASDIVSEVVRPDCKRRKGVRVSRQNRVLAKAIGGPRI